MVRKKRVVKGAKKKVAKKAAVKSIKTRRSLAKKTTKRSAKKSTAKTVKKVIRKAVPKRSPILEYEQVITKARDQLGKAHVRAVVQCEKSVDKLQVQLERAMVKQKLQREKKAAAVKRVAEKPTQGAKNQVVRARDALNLISGSIKEIRSELKAAKLMLAEVKNAQKKNAAMEKQLERFEKDWAKAAKPKRRARKRPRQKAATGSVTTTTDATRVEASERKQTSLDSASESGSSED